MKFFLKIILSALARLTLRRFQPRVIGITGSLGKTSAKEAVKVVLSKKFRVRVSEQNYNNEFGVPLTILGELSPKKNVIKWLSLIVKALIRLFGAQYPHVLVLEMGADRPYDLKYLVNLVGKLEIGVLTDIGISHLEFFGSKENLIKEKLTIVKTLDRGSIAVVNIDNKIIADNIKGIKAKLVTYGLESNAQVKATDVQLIEKNNQWGINYKVHNNGSVVPIFIPNVLGFGVVYASLAAIAAGLQYGMNMVEIAQGLEKYEAPPGRLRLLAGIKRTTILDDTYNSAPSSTKMALEALSLIVSHVPDGTVARGRKVVALADMAELGLESEIAHKNLAQNIVDSGSAVVFLIGPLTKITAQELKQLKFSGLVFPFETAEAARMKVQEMLQEGDIILVKGSQSMRMEKIVKEIMRDPLKADQLLVRQSKDWLEKP